MSEARRSTALSSRMRMLRMIAAESLEVDVQTVVNVCIKVNGVSMKIDLQP